MLNFNASFSSLLAANYQQHHANCSADVTSDGWVRQCMRCLVRDRSTGWSEQQRWPNLPCAQFALRMITLDVDANFTYGNTTIFAPKDRCVLCPMSRRCMQMA